MCRAGRGIAEPKKNTIRERRMVFFRKSKTQPFFAAALGAAAGAALAAGAAGLDAK